MANKPTPPEITAIDLLARQYADAQTDLDGSLNELKQEIDASVRKRWPDLRRATTRAAERIEALVAAVSDARSAFEKPKTRILHGVRVGWRRAQESVLVLNADNTCTLIKRVMPDQEDILIATTERPVMDGLMQLDDASLKLIGCKRVPGSDAPFAKLADTELDKVVAALMKGAIEKAEQEA
jgi:hypothetical protein